MSMSSKENSCIETFVNLVYLHVYKCAFYRSKTHANTTVPFMTK